MTLKYARNFGEGRVAWRSVQLLAVSEGRRSRSQGARVGARRGFLLGLIPGGIIALVGVIGSSSDFACIGCGTVVFVIPAALIVTGTATGAAFGAAFPGERWRTVVPSPR